MSSVKTYTRKSDGAEVQAIRLTRDNVAEVMEFRNAEAFHESEIHKRIVYSTASNVVTSMRFGEWLVDYGDCWKVTSNGNFQSLFRLPDTPELANLKAQAKAASESVEVWRERLEAIRAIDSSLGVENCPLCVLNTKDDGSDLDCSKCPIALISGVSGCNSTPYYEVARLLSLTSRAIKKMVDYIMPAETEANARVENYGKEAESDRQSDLMLSILMPPKPGLD